MLYLKLGQHFSFLFLVSTRMLYREINHEVDMNSKAGPHPSWPTQKMQCAIPDMSVHHDGIAKVSNDSDFRDDMDPRVYNTSHSRTNYFRAGPERAQRQISCHSVAFWARLNQIFNSVPFYAG